MPVTQPVKYQPLSAPKGYPLSTAAAEPFMPAEGSERLDNLAFDLASEASALAGQIHPIVRHAVASLVRSMNCYYSNLIEGHNTHPRDIDRALAADYASELQRRIELFARDEEDAERLPRRSALLLREALLVGELERGRIPMLLDASERTARRVVAALAEKGLLVSESHKVSLRLGFPIDVIERWFPKLYPVGI